jgi:hypothetical protein
VETILTGLRTEEITSIEQGDKIVNEALASLAPEDRKLAYLRICQRLKHGIWLDTQAAKEDVPSTKRNRRFARQYYAAVTVKVDGEDQEWKLAAKPDDVVINGEEGFVPDSINVIDDKTGGRVTEYMLAQLEWFGMVVSLWVKDKIRQGLLQYKPHQMARRKGGHHLSRRRFEPQIKLLARLLGQQRTNNGWVDAVQPKGQKYDRRLEESRVNDVKRVIKKIALAFKDNEFPATACADCATCFFQTGCPGFATWAKEHPETIWPRHYRGHVRAPQFTARSFTPWQPEPAAQLPAAALTQEAPQATIAA